MTNIFFMHPLDNNYSIAEMLILQWYLTFTLDINVTVKNTQNDTAWMAVSLSHFASPWFPLNALTKSITKNVDNPKVDTVNKVRFIADYAWFSTCLYQLANCDMFFTTGQDIVMMPGIASFEGLALGLGVPQMMWRNDARELWNYGMHPNMAIISNPNISDTFPNINHTIESISFNNGSPNITNNIKILYDNAKKSQPPVNSKLVMQIINSNPKLSRAYAFGEKMIQWITEWQYKVSNDETLINKLNNLNWFDLPHQKLGDLGYLMPGSINEPIYLESDIYIYGLLQIEYASELLKKNHEWLNKTDRAWLNNSEPGPEYANYYL